MSARYTNIHGLDHFAKGAMRFFGHPVVQNAALGTAVTVLADAASSGQKDLLTTGLVATTSFILKSIIVGMPLTFRNRLQVVGEPQSNNLIIDRKGEDSNPAATQNAIRSTERAINYFVASSCACGIMSTINTAVSASHYEPSTLIGNATAVAGAFVYYVRQKKKLTNGEWTATTKPPEQENRELEAKRTPAPMLAQQPSYRRSFQP